MQFWIIQGSTACRLGGLFFCCRRDSSLIFGLMRLANLTHGAFFMLGKPFWGDGAAYLRWLEYLGDGDRRRIAVAAIAGLFERPLVLLTRLKTNPLGQVLVTLGMSFIISDACLMLWGGDPITGTDAAELAIADPGIWLRVSNLSAGAGGLRHWCCDRAVFPAGTDPPRRHDPRRRRRQPDGARGRNTRFQFVYGGILPRARASPAPAASGRTDSCSAYPGLDADMLPLALIVVILGGLEACSALSSAAS